VTRSIAAALLLVACNSGSGDPAIPLPGSGPGAAEGYPEGPYSKTNLGAVMENLTFIGYPRPADGLGEAARIEIALGDFHNPTGEGTFGAGSPYGEGAPKPKALVIAVAGLWCQPCREEAAGTLPDVYAELHDDGLEILGVLADSQAVESPATFHDLDNWVTTHGSAYPSVLDPTFELRATLSGLPGNLLIDLRTMTIRQRIIAKPEQPFWSSVDQLLAE
jgi:hypothetical protein